MDYRGHGQSDKPQDITSVTIENLARDLLDLMDELNIPSVPVLGHSLGVNIILDLYRLAPHRVKALVLANGTPKDPFETMFHHNFLQVLFPLVHKVHSLAPALLNRFWRTQGTNPINQELVALAGFNTNYAKREDINEYLRITSTVDLDIFLNLLKDFMSSDASYWLHEVKCPTLVISGERDLITPPSTQKVLHELIPLSEYHVIPEGSHCPQMEKPVEVNSIIEDFLHRLESGVAIKPKKRKTKKKEVSSSARA